jgi:hypothetical protein
LTGQGATEKIKRENDVHLRQLAQKSTYVPSFFFFFLKSAFLGVSRQGEFENTRNKIEYVKYFFGGGIFSGFRVIFFNFFSFQFFVALVKRLSVRGTQRRDKKVLRGRASNFFPPCRFFFIAFLGVSR